MALLYNDLVKAQGGRAVNAQSGEVTMAPGYAPLPQIAPSGQATYGPQAPNPNDPVSNFNLELMKMMQEFQQPQLAQQSQLQDTQNTQALSGAGMEDFRPGYQASAINQRGSEYEGAISNINLRIKNFENVLKVAKEAGEAYAKNVKPSEQTIEAVKMGMKYGQLPSDATMAKLGNSITEEDWQAYAESKKTDDKNSQNTEILDGNKYRVSYDASGNVVNKVLLGKATDGDGTGTVTERKDNAKAQVVNDAIAELERQKSSSTDKAANPNTYREFMTKYINAGGSAAAFKAAVSIQNYIAPVNQQGDLKQAGGTTGRTVR